MGRVLALLYGVVCYAILFVTLLYLFGFMAGVMVPKAIDDGATGSLVTAIVVNLLLITAFGVQHSVMARPGFKKVWTRIVPVSIERSTFCLITSLILMAMFVFWQPMPQVVWQAEGGFATLMWGMFLTGMALVFASTFIIDHFDLFGLRQVWLNFKQRPYTHHGFAVGYLYRFVRHPLYLGMLMMFWFVPTMTVGHLLFSLGMSAYIFVGIHYEERDLQKFLGEPYRRYREKVPMILPRPGVVHDKVVAPKGDPLAH